MHSTGGLAVAALLLAFVSTAQSQQTPAPEARGYAIEITPLKPSARITEHPIPVNMELATQFVRIGFGLETRDVGGFDSTQFLTPFLGTRQASELVRLVPEYGHFKGDLVARAIGRFAGRVSYVQFGREGSPVLYINLPYWTHQREGLLTKLPGVRIPEAETAALVQELNEVFVGELGAEEFSLGDIDKHTVRIWWHH